TLRGAVRHRAAGLPTRRGRRATAALHRSRHVRRRAALAAMAEVPPFLWSDAGTFPSPKTYKVPGAGEVQPYTATATYVNASGQAILPALRIKSAEGALLSLTFPVGSTIANGASSEVTFVPAFGSAQGSGSTPITSTGLP